MHVVSEVSPIKLNGTYSQEMYSGLQPNRATKQALKSGQKASEVESISGLTRFMQF